MKIDRKHFYPKIPTGAQISTQRPTLLVSKFLALFFDLDLYPFIFISQINLASFTGSSATGKISRLVH